MKGKQSGFAILIGVLACTGAMAELPETSILNRYGVTSDRLPGVPADTAVVPAMGKPRFEIGPPVPWASMAPEQPRKQGMTGNISIDRAIEQEQDRCRRLRNFASPQKQGWLSCDEGDSGAGISVEPAP